MQDTELPSPRRRLLPLAVAAVALVLYLATLNHWVALQSLAVTAQVGGWDNDLPVTTPLLYVVTRPLALLPATQLPLAANVFTALLAALTVGVLARCVMLLPQDRTHSQRIRGYADGRPLAGPLAWVPPILATGLLGLQLTFWEHSTALTGEALNALLFGCCVLCLLEFRRDQREWRLNCCTFLLGLGMANNWAMVGFAPLFVGALLWTGGWTMLSVSRLLRLAAFGLLGLLLILLMPLVGAGHAGLPEGFTAALDSLIQTQRANLLGAPRSRFLLLAAVMVLPLLLAGIRFASPRGSGFERVITMVVVNFLQLVWLVGNIWFAFDPAIGPRMLVTTAPGYSNTGLLTFHFCSALSVGYLAGYFLLLGTVRPDRKSVQHPSAFAPFGRALAYALAAAAVAVPAVLAVRNWPAIQVQNGPVLAELASALVEPLPAQPAVVVTEDPLLYALFNARLRRDASLPAHVAIHTRQAPEASYRRYLATRFGAAWPGLQVVAAARDNVGGVFLNFLNDASLTNRAFYLNPGVTFLTEVNQLRPRGAIFQLAPYHAGQVEPDPLGDAEAKAMESFWLAQAPVLARLTNIVRHNATVDYASAFWSRAANCSGVELQKSGRLDPAGRMFALSSGLFEANAAARVNASVNARLREGKPIDAAVRQPIERFGVGIVDPFGPVDEPRFLEQFGDALLTLGDPLVRASAISFLRAQKLDPRSLDAVIGYARACIGANEPDLALTVLKSARELAATQTVTPAQSSHMARVEANARMRKADGSGAERVLREALDKVPDDLPLLDLITILYVEMDGPGSTNRANTLKAIPYVDRMLKQRPDDESLFERKGFLQLQGGLYDEAVKTLDQLLARRPDQTSARMNRATAHFLAGRTEAAKSDFEIVHKKLPTAVDALIGLIKVAAAQTNKTEEIRLLEKAGEVLPTDAPLRTNLLQRLDQLKASP